jgi:hypothetical protein
MKKTLVVLLILAVAGGVFAQDITFSGSVSTGLRLTAEAGDNAADPAVDLYHDDAVGPQFGIYGEYAADNYGLKLGIVGDASASPLFDVDNAFLWFKPLDLLKISAGKGFGDIPNVYDFATGGGPGVQFLVTPIEGLTIGLTLTPPNGDYGTYEPGYFLQETAFGVKYESDPFKAHIALKLDSNADTGSTSWDAFGYKAYWLGVDPVNNKEENYQFSFAPDPGSGEKQIFASAAVEVTAVPNLTIDVGGKVDHLNDWASDGSARVEIHEKVAYQISDPFNVYLTVKEVFYSVKDIPTGLHGEAGLGYKINDTFKVSLALGADNWLLPDIDNPLVFYNDNAGFKNDIVWFKPSVDITVGEKASITFYYKGTVQNTLKDLPDRPFKSLAQVNFNWSF